MISKTKNYIDKTTIAQLFICAGLGAPSSIEDLAAGEFNAAYSVAACGKDYVLKIAPNSHEHLLTYEKDLMAQEVAFYDTIATNTTVRTPKVYHWDDSCTFIDSPYFIMEKMTSSPLTHCKLSTQDKLLAYDSVAEAIAQLHSIKGQGFGYVQNGLHDNWYLALQSMVTNLIDDCTRYNKPCKKGKLLLRYIDKYKEILEKVDSVYTHFDIWDGNIFYQNNGGKIEISIIDTERGFWGDGIGDFVNIQLLRDLPNKSCLDAYNKIADAPITATPEQVIRYNIMLGYLALIVYTEKFARYKVLQSKYLINTLMASLLCKKAFKALKRGIRDE